MNSTFTTIDVLDVAEQLIKDNNETTTLEIKEELRKKGFKAFQSDVSEVMATEHHTRNFSYSENGTHRIYSIVTSQPQYLSSGGLGSVGILLPQSNVNTSQIHSYKRKDGLIVQNINRQKGAWTIFDVNNKANILYFPSNISRSMARQAFANLTHTKYDNTRSKTVKN